MAALAIWSLTGCSSPEDYERAKLICESTSRSFPSNRIDAEGEGLTDTDGHLVSDMVVRELLATGRLGFVEQKNVSSYWEGFLGGDYSEKYGKFARVELVNSDPVDCSKGRDSFHRYFMYVNGMRPDQCVNVSLQEKGSGRFVLSSEHRKEGKGVVVDMSLSDREYGSSPFKVVSAWSHWGGTQYPIFKIGKRASCVADTNSIGRTFTAPLGGGLRVNLPPALNVKAADVVGDLRLKKVARMDYKRSSELASVSESGEFVIAAQGYQVLLLNNEGFVAHYDFRKAFLGQGVPTVIAMDAGLVLLTKKDKGLVVSYLDPTSGDLRSFRAVDEDSGEQLQVLAGEKAGYVRGGKLMVYPYLSAFQADMSQLLVTPR